jgi:signal transduction histidine kinase
VLEKRNRLARDLHDAVSQRLWTASLLAEVVPDQVRDAPQEAMHNLARLRQLTRGALAETRMLLLELRPAAPQRAELGELLRQLADRVSSRKKLDIHLDVQRHRAPPAEVKIGLYRIASEALSSAAKHAQATQAWMGLSGAGKRPCPWSCATTAAASTRASRAPTAWGFRSCANGPRRLEVCLRSRAPLDWAPASPSTGRPMKE